MYAQSFEYHVEEKRFVGYLAHQAATAQKLPGLLIVHDWCGCDDFVKEKARMLAEEGYVALAVDMYGDGKVGKDDAENAALSDNLLQDRRVIAQRMQGALSALRSVEHVDRKNVAVIGYCFGGLCALDLARSGADVNGVCGFHTMLRPPDFPNQQIKAKVLAMQGYDDPLVPQEQVTAFAQEMAAADADWQVHMYGLAQHSYTKKSRPGPATGYQWRTSLRKSFINPQERLSADSL